MKFLNLKSNSQLLSKNKKSILWFKYKKQILFSSTNFFFRCYVISNFKKKLVFIPLNGCNKVVFGSSCNHKAIVSNKDYFFFTDKEITYSGKIYAFLSNIRTSQLPLDLENKDIISSKVKVNCTSGIKKIICVPSTIPVTELPDSNQINTLNAEKHLNSVYKLKGANLVSNLPEGDSVVKVLDINSKELIEEFLLF